MTDEQALAWFEGGIRLESAEQAGEAFRRAAAALRIKGQLVEALLAAQRVDRLGATASERQQARDLWTAALKAAKETPHG